MAQERQWPGSAGERALQERMGTTDRADRFYDEQVLDALNPEMQDFVARQSMVFVATADEGGSVDCSLRAGPAGFVHVLDSRTLAYPEYRGNGVMASLGNLTENGHVGLLFVDFFTHVIGLHVNGAARVVADDVLRAREPLLARDPHPGRAASLWVVVHVEEAYVHGSEHIPLLIELPKQQHRGIDDHTRKRGDFFHAASSRTSRRR